MKKEARDLKENKHEYKGGFGGREEKEETNLKWKRNVTISTYLLISYAF